MVGQVRGFHAPVIRLPPASCSELPAAVHGLEHSPLPRPRDRAGSPAGPGSRVVDDTVTVVRRFHGKNDSGKAVTWKIRSRSTGPPPRLRNPDCAGTVASSRRSTARTVRALAGEWRGHSRDQNGFDLPLHVVVRTDVVRRRRRGPGPSRYQGTLSVRDGQILVVTQGGTREGLGSTRNRARGFLAGQLPRRHQPAAVPVQPAPRAEAAFRCHVAVTPPPRPVPPVAPAPAPVTASPPAAGIRASYQVNSSALRVELGYRSPGGRTEEREVVIPADVIWELLFTAREGDALEVTAQNPGESGWVTCEFVVDGTAISASTRKGTTRSRPAGPRSSPADGGTGADSVGLRLREPLRRLRQRLQLPRRRRRCRWTARPAGPPP